MTDIDSQKFYDNKIIMSENEKVNGYKLYNLNDELFDYETFKKFSILFVDNNTIPHDEFIEWLDDNCCSDWNKQDRYGECFGGFWKYPEYSYEKENAYELSRKDNFEALCELPYPREAIKLTIDIGCGNRMESVRYSNFICEWVKRKMDVIK